MHDFPTFWYENAGQSSATEPRDAARTAADALTSIAEDVRRLANGLIPAPQDVVDSRHVADVLHCSTAWVSCLVRAGEIPKRCIVPGTGNGKPWKFHADEITAWCKSR